MLENTLAIREMLKSKSILMWFIATIFSFLQFFLQVVTNTMADPLMHSFSLSPGQVGVLSSAFFYTFIAMQIPAGYFLEKYSVKIVLTICALLCALGSLLFSLSHNLTFAIISRAIMGVGAGFGFLGMLTITRTWFDIRIFSLMVGLSELVAMLLTAVGEKIMVPMVAMLGWRESMMMISLFSLLVCIAIYLFIENKQKTHDVAATNFKKQLVYVLAKPECWMAGIFGLGMFAVVTVFNALWGLKFLSVVYNYSAAQAATGISAVFVGLAVGCPIIGLCVAKFQKKLPIMALGALTSLIFSVLLIHQVTDYSSATVLLLLFALGFACGSYYLCYEVAAEYVDAEHKSMAIAFCSMLVIMGAVILQPIMGYIMQLLGYQDHLNTTPAVMCYSFKTAMLLIVLAQFISLLVSFLLIRKPRLEASYD